MIASDSTAIIHLSRIGRLSLLKLVFGQIIIPEAVYIETVIKGKQKLLPEAQNIEFQNWIVRNDLSEKWMKEAESLMAAANIGKGEAEAIVLAKAEKIGLVIDDAVGVGIANAFGIDTYWTTSVIIKAVSEKLIKKQEAKTVLEDLVTSGYRLRPEILIRIMKILEEC